MSLFEMLTSALRGITANKLRSVLTLLGVMIGVASVILLLAVGNGSSQQIRDAISDLGTNTLTVRTSQGGGPDAEATSTASITTSVVDDLAAAGLGHVASVVPQVSTSLTVASTDTSEESVTVIGTTPGYFEVGTASVATGDAFTDADVTSAAKVAVIGQTLATTLYPTGSALGQSVTIDGSPFTVVGILATQSSTGISDSNSVVLAPISRVQRSYTGFGAVSTVTVEAIDSESVDAASAEIEILLNQLLGLTSETETYTITNQSSLLETQQASADSFTVLLGAVAAISLLVGGIGVTNVMLVSVTERTREIGIRKALGATRRAILGQFLLEAATLTLLGGVLGVIAALIGANYEINGTQPVVLDYSIPLALGVSVAIGVFFGVYPAARAAAMRPIQALRAS
ncbi:FtsX-like permease family protein [Glaciihabitans arcticus]|uniref:FtsX-like permease family protein n=1 Tax=Glaciihabitans arcticus TaxID=2668039 RepID=A0A4Q9GUQ0_9MICO|nr:ABC transporter permease [Glaciihabitans arcticus]TBN57934.1 FtsX-like permease family protein [Glaciihabitans arcticus]